MSGPSVLAALTMAVLEATEGLGFDGDELRGAAGLPPAQLADPDARIPLEQHLRLWERIARRPVGLELGTRLGVAGLGIVGYALPPGATVGDAIAFLGRLRAVVHEDAVPRVELRAGEVVFTSVVPPPFARLVEPVCAEAAATVAVVRVLAGDAVRPLRVALSRPRPSDTSRHDAYYGCPIAWSAPTLEVAFEAAILAAELPRAEPRLFGYLAARADELLARLPDEARVATRARREIGPLLVNGEPGLATVARRLGMASRTLHRSLAEEQTGFAHLVDEARRERAFLLLGDRRLSASEVAFLLGYAEPSAFFRAFRRWTRTTPDAWRRGLGSAGAA